MAERVYPSAKSTDNGAATAPTTVNPAFPANKAQLYNAQRPAYRPQPAPKKRHRRGCCCSCCLWITLLILLLLLIVAIAGAVFYVLYRPHRPSFTVTSLHLSNFNLTDTSLTSSFNFTLTARNRNSKITFSYEPIAVKILSGDVDVGDGSFPGFIHGRKNVTTLRTVVSSSKQLSQGTDVSSLRSSLRNRDLPLTIQLDTKVKVKIGKITTKKLKIRVVCDGLKVSVLSDRTAATVTHIKCKVDPRIKIIKWTV